MAAGMAWLQAKENESTKVRRSNRPCSSSQDVRRSSLPPRPSHCVERPLRSSRGAQRSSSTYAIETDRGNSCTGPNQSVGLLPSSSLSSTPRASNSLSEIQSNASVARNLSRAASVRVDFACHDGAVNGRSGNSGGGNSGGGG
eukprot:2090403-Pleurochrysis_carterae.AAC.1